MSDRLGPLLACPLCGGALFERDERLACADGHSYGIVDGIPRLFREEEGSDASSIRESFSSEWSAFRHGEDRPWGPDFHERGQKALQELDCNPEWLRGRLVLDAGCGAGKLSSILASWGADVVATDISYSVDAARDATSGPAMRHIDFVQADLNHPPFRPGSFDVIFSGGVLHHNPDTRQSLEVLLDLLAPGGTIYVWLYRPLPGVAHKVRAVVRRAVVRLPARVQRAIFRPWAAQSLLRQRLRAATGRESSDVRHNFRERLVTLLDHYTPRYRWEHTPDEVRHWYEERGLTDIRQTDDSTYGFGMLARLPAAAEMRPAGAEPVHYSLPGVRRAS
jgi:SAM-dependent methyltransferase